MAVIRFKQANIIVEVPDNSSIAKICAENGVFFGCRSGGCGTCIVQILSGEENLYPPGEEEIEFFGEDISNERLACQLVIRSGAVEIL